MGCHVWSLGNVERMGRLEMKCLPARGGKRMAIKPRKISDEHIVICLMNMFV